MRKIVAVLIAGIVVLAGAAFIAYHINANKTTEETEEKRRTLTVMRIEEYPAHSRDFSHAVSRVFLLYRFIAERRKHCRPQNAEPTVILRNNRKYVAK